MSGAPPSFAVAVPTDATRSSPRPDPADVMAQRLQRLQPLRDDYATQPILAGFNWDEALGDAEAGEWYLVVFRSVRRVTACTFTLTEFDDAAFAEALASGGLLYYFRGGLDPLRRCLSFCVWGSPEQARLALHLPRHRAASGLVREMYESYRLERYVLRKQTRSAPLEALPLD